MKNTYTIALILAGSRNKPSKPAAVHLPQSPSIQAIPGPKMALTAAKGMEKEWTALNQLITDMPEPVYPEPPATRLPLTHYPSVHLIFYLSLLT